MVVVYMYMRQGEPVATSERWINLTAGITAVATLLLGIFSGPLFSWASQAMLQLF